MYTKKFFDYEKMLTIDKIMCLIPIKKQSSGATLLFELWKFILSL